MNCEQKSVELYLPVPYSNVGGKVETITKTRLHAHCLNPLHICLVGVRRYSGTNFCYHHFMRDGEEVKEAFDAQASSAEESRELCNLFGFEAGGRHDDRCRCLLSLIAGPPSRRRVGWLDLLLQAHAAGAQSFDDLEPDELEAAELDGDGDVRLLPGSISLLLDLRDRLPSGLDSAPSFSVLPDLVRADQDGRTSFSLRVPLAAAAVFAGQLAPDGNAVAQGGDDPVALEQRIRASLLRDIRDGKLVVPSDTTVASQRSAFAFDLRSLSC